MPETESRDDRLVTCPECHSTFEAEDGTIVQHPAAPETETDASGLTDRDVAWAEFRDGPNYTPTDRYPVRDAFDAGWTLAHQMRVAPLLERVRVVEGERDAARAGQRESWKYVCEIAGLIGVEPDDGHPMDAVDRLTARAESAEAAHEAEKAARERLRAGVEALADEAGGSLTAGAAQIRRELRVLLGGGEAR